MQLHRYYLLKSATSEIFNIFREEKQPIGIRSVEIDIKKPIATIYLEKKVPKSSVGYLFFSFRGDFQTVFTEAFFKSTYSVEENER